MKKLVTILAFVFALAAVPVGESGRAREKRLCRCSAEESFPSSIAVLGIRRVGNAHVDDVAGRSRPDELERDRRARFDPRRAEGDGRSFEFAFEGTGGRVAVPAHELPLVTIESDSDDTGTGRPRQQCRGGVGPSGGRGHDAREYSQNRRRARGVHGLHL